MSLSPSLFLLLYLYALFHHPSQCWCLSYVFSVFGLFSYCLPGLFGSSPSQPVCFLALLECWSVHVCCSEGLFVLSFIISHNYCPAYQHSSCGMTCYIFPPPAFSLVKSFFVFARFDFYCLYFLKASFILKHGVCFVFAFVVFNFLCFLCLGFLFHFLRVLSCMCMVVSRPLWRT